ncbi:MAG: YkoF family thiamine/hydroxymethylpyrimidine-binding protein [Myxococcota bacterium]
MSLSAQISVYPLRQQHLGPAIEAVRLALESGGLEPEVGPMSTLVRGDADKIFAALREAFERATAAGDVAMVLTLSNACPAEVRGARVVGDL